LQCYNPAETQHWCRATMPMSLSMLYAAVLLCIASWNQPCLALSSHLWVFAVLQSCRNPALMQSNHANEPKHAVCSSAALHCKLKSALLGTAITPRGFWSAYNPAETQRLSTPTMPVSLCMLYAAVLLCIASWN